MWKGIWNILPFAPVKGIGTFRRLYAEQKTQLHLSALLEVPRENK